MKKKTTQLDLDTLAPNEVWIGLVDLEGTILFHIQHRHHSEIANVGVYRDDLCKLYTYYLTWALGLPNNGFKKIKCTFGNEPLASLFGHMAMVNAAGDKLIGN